MSRCVLISPMCTENQNVGPKKWLVSDNQNQITSLISLLRNGQTQISVHWPLPWNMWYSPFCSFMTYQVKQPINVLQSSQNHNSSHWTSVFGQWLDSFKSTRRPDFIIIDQLLNTDKVIPCDQIMHDAHVSLLALDSNLYTIAHIKQV